MKNKLKKIRNFGIGTLAAALISTGNVAADEPEGSYHKGIYIRESKNNEVTQLSDKQKRQILSGYHDWFDVISAPDVRRYVREKHLQDTIKFGDFVSFIYKDDGSKSDFFIDGRRYGVGKVRHGWLTCEHDTNFSFPETYFVAELDENGNIGQFLLEEPDSRSWKSIRKMKDFLPIVQESALEEHVKNFVEDMNRKNPNYRYRQFGEYQFDKYGIKARYIIAVDDKKNGGPTEYVQIESKYRDGNYHSPTQVMDQPFVKR